MAIRIELPPVIWEQICDQAGREWRTPKQQAEFLILQALGWEWPPSEDAPPKPPTSTPPTKASAPGASGGAA